MLFVIVPIPGDCLWSDQARRTSRAVFFNHPPYARRMPIGKMADLHAFEHNCAQELLTPVSEDAQFLRALASDTCFRISFGIRLWAFCLCMILHAYSWSGF